MLHLLLDFARRYGQGLDRFHCTGAILYIIAYKNPIVKDFSEFCNSDAILIQNPSPPLAKKYNSVQNSYAFSKTVRQRNTVVFTKKAFFRH